MPKFIFAFALALCSPFIFAQQTFSEKELNDFLNQNTNYKVEVKDSILSYDYTFATLLSKEPPVAKKVSFDLRKRVLYTTEAYPATQTTTLFLHYKDREQIIANGTIRMTGLPFPKTDAALIQKAILTMKSYYKAKTTGRK